MTHASRGRGWLGWALLVAVGAVVLLWAPLLNGFPLIYHDTGTYLLSSYTLKVPADRPIGYSLFILLTRVYPSVWAPVVAQALATSFLVLRGAALLLPERPWRGAAALAVLVVATAVTSLSGFVGYLMPDVFAGWIPLGVLLVLLGARRLDRVAGAAAVALAMFVHNGNVYLALAAIAVVLGVCWLVPAARGGRRPAAALAAAALLVVPAVGLVHWALGAGFTVSRGAPTQLLNKLVATGVVDGTLAAYCPGSGWTLCGSRDLLAKHRDGSFWFMWGDDSPIGELGWEQGGGEQSAVDLATMRCCLRAFAAAELAEVRAGLAEASGVPALPVFVEQHAPPTVLRRYDPAELGAFWASAQQSGHPAPTMPVPPDGASTQRALELGAAALAALCLLAGRRRAAVVVLAFLGFVLLNAVLVGLLTEHEDRLLSRVSWLVPYGMLLGLVAAWRPAAAPASARVEAPAADTPARSAAGLAAPARPEVVPNAR